MKTKYFFEKIWFPFLLIILIGSGKIYAQEKSADGKVPLNLGKPIVLNKHSDLSLLDKYFLYKNSCDNGEGVKENCFMQARMLSNKKIVKKLFGTGTPEELKKMRKKKKEESEDDYIDATIAHEDKRLRYIDTKMEGGGCQTKEEVKYRDVWSTLKELDPADLDYDSGHALASQNLETLKKKEPKMGEPNERAKRYKSCLTNSYCNYAKALQSSNKSEGEILRISNLCLELKGKVQKSGSQLLKWAAIFLTGFVVFIIFGQIFQDNEEFQASEQIEDGENASKALAQNHGPILKYSRPFFKRYITPVVQSMKSGFKKKIREKYKRKLSSAGLTDVLTAEDMYSFKIFLIVGFPVVFFGVRQFLGETWPLNLIPVIAIAGFFYPDIWISQKIKARQKEVIQNMPFAVDMLALSVEAGLDFIAAMAKVVEKAKVSALSYEFEVLLKEIKVGASRAEALRNMAWRINLIQISSFCATLIAADSVGASIGPILKALAQEIRQKRSSDVEKAGATAATKILFPMLFLIVPAVLIVVAAPLVLANLKGNK